MTEERFKEWYHGSLAVAALAEVFSATTRLRKGLLLMAAGWHAHCVAQHIADDRPYTFPNKALFPKKTVVFDQEHCTAWEETRGGIKANDPYHDQGNGTNHRVSQCTEDCFR